MERGLSRHLPRDRYSRTIASSSARLRDPVTLMTPAGHRLLLIVDEDSRADALAPSLAAAGWGTLATRDAEGTLATLGTHEGMQLDALLLNADLPLRDPPSLVRRVRGLRPQLPIVVATSGRRSSAVVDALRAGASDYLLTPLSPDRVLGALERATEQEEEDELRPLSEPLPHRPALDRAVGSAPAFRTALAIAAKAARARSPVLIGGERGSGRMRLARAIHAASGRAGGPFVCVDVGSGSEDELDRTLFGLDPAAGSSRHGAVVDADGGTLYLHGIGHLPGPLQARLVHAIKEDEVQATGSGIRHHVDVRVIASHNGELAEAMADGGFREDLYYALAAATLDLPPLRERPGDLPALTRDILRRIGEMTGARPPGVTDGALSLLRRHDWPGNIRQLETALFRAVALCNGDALTEFDFPALYGRLGEEAGPVRSGAGVELFVEGELRPLAEIEADVIRLAIHHYGGRMSEVARRLGIGRSTLYRKLSDLGIDNAA